MSRREPSPAAAPAPPAGSPWLVTPAFDLGIYSGLILLSAVGVLGLRRWVEPKRMFLYFNIGFSLMHYGPTWARAYLDKAEFRRHRFQIVAFPLLFFWFAYAVREQPLVLAFIAFFWDRFHALMQNYGFLRLYGVKSGFKPISSGLELAVLFSSAAAVMTFNMGLLAPPLQLLYQLGLPPVTAPAVIKGLRFAAVGASACLGAWYVRENLRVARGAPASAGVPKLVYWASLLGGHLLMNLTSNVFLLSAHEKVYHSTQYAALVWHYNRKRNQKAAPGELTRPFRAMFSSRGPWLYLGALLAWTGLGFGLNRAYSLPSDSAAGTPALSTLFVGIALTHYYFDSFLWRVRKAGVRANL